MVFALAAFVPGLASAAGDAAQGAQVFRDCTACHSTEAGVNMTGPSLAGILGRKAGSLPGFHRYSEALEHSGILWNDATLDAWVRNPAKLVPGNAMNFAGIANAAARANLIAYLHQATEGKGGTGPATGGMPMANGSGGLPDLKSAPPEAKVKRITYCDDTYTVVTGDGRTRKFWEFNLRFETDSSKHGPAHDPVLVSQGMAGDRAQMVFARPEDIAAFIKRQCAE